MNSCLQHLRTSFQDRTEVPCIEGCEVLATGPPGKSQATYLLCASFPPSMKHRWQYSHHKLCCCSVTQSCPTLGPQGIWHARLPCPSPSPQICSNSCPLSWCYPTISFSIIPFSSCLQSFPTSGSLPISWLFASGGQSIEASASALVLPMNIQGWFPLGLIDLLSLQSKGLSKIFSSTTVWKHQFFSSQPSLWPHFTFVHDYRKNSFDWTELCQQSDSAF